MFLNQAALKRQITVVVLMLLIIVLGAYSYLSLPRESDPDITIPYVFVTTTYEGVAPKDVETLITIPLERKIKGLSGIEEVTSTSDDGVSSIAVEFKTGVDIDDAVQKVRDKVDQAKADLPEDLDNDPIITEMNFSESPVIYVVLSGPFSLKRLKTFAEDFEDRFEGIEGVLDAEILGGLDREIHVLFDQDRVAGYKVPLSELMRALEQGNVNMPGGSMDIGDAKYLVRVPEEFEHVKDIDSIVAYVKDGKPVYLRDLAEIKDHYADPSSINRFDGNPSVTVEVVKRSGENIIAIVNEVRSIVEEMRPQMPPNLNIDLTNDAAEDVNMMVSDLENNILTGLFLVLAVVLVFIGGRSAVFVAAAIPFSMLITFVLLHAFGITLNIVVLFSLTLALGMLVDNGIVIVENIYRHMQEGKSRQQAARDAVDEVAWPVITSTLTTVGAFFPLIFWPGIMGEFMSFLPKTVIFALFGSLFVALVINPVLSARYQTVKVGAVGPDHYDENTLSKPKRIYKTLLEFALRRRILTVAAAVLLLIVSAVSFGVFGKGVEFFPDIEPKYADVTIKAPVGTNLQASDRFVHKAETVVAEYEDIKHYITTVGTEDGTHVSKITLEFKDFRDRSRSSFDIIGELRERLSGMIKGAEVRVEKAHEGPPSGAAVNLEIYGEDIAVLGELTREARKIIAEVRGVVDLKDDFISGKPEIKVDVDKEKAALMGLDAFSIAYTVKAAINGVKVGVYREGKEEYDIIARLPEEDRKSIQDLKRITVAGPNGEAVPLTSLAEVKVTGGYGAINHIDQKRVVTVSSDVSGRLANEIIAEIKTELDKMSWPRGYTYSFTGEQQEQQKASAFLSKAFAVAVFIIFLVLVTQFNSAMTPFIILTSVILSLIGVFLGLLVTGKPFGVIMTGVGVISLAGVVVNNAIVLIDYFEQLKAEGMSVKDALIKTGMVRFRPVLLTAVTTILGLLPMALGISFNFFEFAFEIGGESSQWWSSMAIAVIFGLAVATLLTLVIVPVLCSLKESLKGKSSAVA